MVWTEESEQRSTAPVKKMHYRQGEIELIDELTEDDQPLSRWEVGVDHGRGGAHS
jgi:hypothetical protein